MGFSHKQVDNAAYSHKQKTTLPPGLMSGYDLLGGKSDFIPLLVLSGFSYFPLCACSHSIVISYIYHIPPPPTIQLILLLFIMISQHWLHKWGICVHSVVTGQGTQQREVRWEDHLEEKKLAEWRFAALKQETRRWTKTQEYVLK